MNWKFLVFTIICFIFIGLGLHFFPAPTLGVVLGLFLITQAL